MAIKRKTVKDNLATALGLINGVAPYYTNFGGVYDASTNPTGRVFRNRISPFAASELPALVIYTRKNVAYPEALKGTNQLMTHRLELNIELICTQGSTNEDTVDQMVADVLRAIGVDRTLSGAAVYTYYTEDETLYGPDQNEKVVAGSIIKISILYQTTAFAES